MHPQASATACALDVDGAGPPLQHAALSARSQAFVHSTASEVINLYMASPHTSASSSSSGRSRVRPRPGHETHAPWRTLLVPVGGAGTRPFSVETKLASAVMAGDDNIEQLSRMMTKRGAAASTAWGLGQSSGSSSAGSRGRRSDHRDKRQPRRRRTQRSGEEKAVESDLAAEESSNGGAGTATAAAAMHTTARSGKAVRREPAHIPTPRTQPCVDKQLVSVRMNAAGRLSACVTTANLCAKLLSVAQHQLYYYCCVTAHTKR